MTCASCGSESFGQFESEITIHSPHLKDVDKHPVSVFAKLSVCLSCGQAHFVVPRPQLARLSSGLSRDAKESSEQPR